MSKQIKNADASHRHLPQRWAFPCNGTRETRSRHSLSAIVFATMLCICGARAADSQLQADAAHVLYRQAGGRGSGSQTPSPITNDASTFDEVSLGRPRRQTAVVLRFAVDSSLVEKAPRLSTRACPATYPKSGSQEAPDITKTLSVDPRILDDLTAELHKRVAKDMAVMVDPELKSIPIGAMVITGCITRANPGNAATRLIGMNVGASRLGVHVVILSKTVSGWQTLDTFDIQVKGGNILPPLGPIGLGVHAVKDVGQTLDADAKKMAKQILKRMARDMKASEATADEISNVK